MWYYSTLKTFIQTNCRFKRPGCFVLRHWSLEIPDFCMTQHLADGQKMKALMWVKNITDSVWKILLFLSQNKYYFNLYEFLKRIIHPLVGKLKNRCFCWFPAVIYLCPEKGHKHDVSIQSFRNLGKMFSEYCAYEILNRPRFGDVYSHPV